MSGPSQRILVHRYLDWKLVEKRLQNYPHINSIFPIDGLKKCSEKPPYFCHYLAWRLGTWNDEDWFAYFDDLLSQGMKLGGWSYQRVPQGCEFDNFWSFIWELEVAVYFINMKKAPSVIWLPSGPDMKVELEGNLFYVECTTYHKSFGIEIFIKSLLQMVDLRLSATHIPCIKFSLQKINLNTFLDELFNPFIDPEFLSNINIKANQRSPIIIPTPNGVENLYIIFDEPNAKEMNMNQPWTGAGDPEQFINLALKEVLEYKASQNNLKSYHPNLLAINYLLGMDFQLALTLRSTSIREVSINPEIDALFICACGIDELPSGKKLLTSIEPTHPAKALLTS
jgi:hypothetical protein